MGKEQMGAKRQESLTALIEELEENEKNKKTPTTTGKKASKNNIRVGVEKTGANNIVINIEDHRDDETPKLGKKQPSALGLVSSSRGGYELDSLIARGGGGDQDYRSIPNNFKKEGVAFPTTETKIQIDAGLAGIYNMGNTCFLSTGNINNDLNQYSCPMSECCSASH